MGDCNITEDFKWLIGEWTLDYRIPKSRWSEERTDAGRGTVKPFLDGQYIRFDYSTESGTSAHGIFARESEADGYRFWWFESSGHHDIAQCAFQKPDVLFMQWGQSPVDQSFEKHGEDQVLLRMYDRAEVDGKPIMEVLFSRLDPGATVPEDTQDDNRNGPDR